MKTSEYTTKVLIADNGCLLTQADDNIDFASRIFAEKIYLSASDSPYKWKEVSFSVADEMREEIKLKKAELRKQMQS